MLERLYELERVLPSLIAERTAWKSLNINYHPPFVERLYRDVGDERLYLHRIYPCERADALLHPHPWPSAMRIVDGMYEMGIGYGPGMSTPPIACTAILVAGTSYEMVDPDGWHYVRPLAHPSLSVMVSGTPWQRVSPKSERILVPLPLHRMNALFEAFSQAYP